MPYTNVTTRADAAALIQESMSTIMLPMLRATSAALTMFRPINVPTSQVRFPVISALPSAYFVTGDTGQKQTTEMAWDNKYINIEELAAIVPIPDNVIFDNYLNVETDILPFVRDAMVRALDAAIFFGTNAPASWPDDITTAATAAGNDYERGTATPAEGGIAEDMNQLIALLLADGYAPTAFVGNPTVQTLLRSARASDGQLLTDVNGGVNNIWGLPTVYPMPGQWPSGNDVAELFALQRENFIIGVRQDFTVTASNTAVIQDSEGAITFNAFQQDMTLFRVVFRVGWQVANPINYTQLTGSDRYPAAVLLTPGAQTMSQADETQATEYRRMMLARTRNKAARERALIGSSAARRQLQEDWQPLIDWFNALENHNGESEVDDTESTEQILNLNPGIE